jgi:hypothetical protein
MYDYRHKTITQMVADLDLTEASRNTYLYIDTDGALCAIEKWDRTAYPVDEVDCIGYLCVYEEYARLNWHKTPVKIH